MNRRFFSTVINSRMIEIHDTLKPAGIVGTFSNSGTGELVVEAILFTLNYLDANPCPANTTNGNSLPLFVGRAMYPQVDKLSEMQRINTERMQLWHGARDLSLLEWCGALAGGVGELSNLANKLLRVELKSSGNAWSDTPLDDEKSKEAGFPQRL